MRHLLLITGLFLLSAGITAQPVTATIVPLHGSQCTGVLRTFSAVTQDTGVSFSWAIFPARGYTVHGDNESRKFQVTFGLPLTFTLTLTAKRSSDVFVTATTFSVSRSAVASFNAVLDNAGYPVKLHLTNHSANAESYLWFFSDLTEALSTTNVTRPYSAPGNYTVQLTANGRNGCNAEEIYAFSIPASSSLVLPNIFTPNEDGVNDLYKPIALGIYEMKASIVNRDGNVVASWDRVGGSWDGRTTAGEPCAAGVYAIVVQAKGFDGQTYSKSGTITLLR